MNEYKIMIVEDDPFVSDVIKFTLSRPEYSLSVAENGKIAIDKLPIVKPDLMILDILMPEMDGWQVLKQIRGDSRFAHLKVLIESALIITPETLAQNKVPRATKVLLKPFSLNDLKLYVKELLSEASSRA